MSAILKTCKAICNQKAISINLRVAQLKKKREKRFFKNSSIELNFLKVFMMYSKNIRTTFSMAT